MCHFQTLKFLAIVGYAILLNFNFSSVCILKHLKGRSRGPQMVRGSQFDNSYIRVYCAVNRCLKLWFAYGDHRRAIFAG